MQTCIDHVLEVLNATEGMGFSWFLQLMSSSDSQAINFLLGGDAPWFGESLGVNSAIVVPRCCWINIKFMFSLIQVYHWYPFFGSTWSFHRNIWSNLWDVRLGSLWTLGSPNFVADWYLGYTHHVLYMSQSQYSFWRFCCSILLRISNTTS